jgi:hypothetical protein
MTESDTLQHQILISGAAMLDQGTRIDGLSRGVTIAAMIGLLAIGVMVGHPDALPMAALALAVLVGLIELYLSIRVMLDAALFRQLATSSVAPDWETFDVALLRLRMLPPAKAGRSAEARMAGARRLLRAQGAVLVVQMSLVVAGAYAVTR